MSIKDVALSRAIAMLHSIGAEYKIVLPDGREFGELASKQAAKPRANYKYLYSDTIAVMHPGDVATIQANGHDIGALQSAVASHCGQLWGKGSYITHRVGGGVEVMRVS